MYIISNQRKHIVIYLLTYTSFVNRKHGWNKSFFDMMPIKNTANMVQKNVLFFSLTAKRNTLWWCYWALAEGKMLLLVISFKGKKEKIIQKLDDLKGFVIKSSIDWMNNWCWGYLVKLSQRNLMLRILFFQLMHFNPTGPMKSRPSSMETREKSS